MLKTKERVITINDLQQDTEAVLRNAQLEPLLVTAEGRPSLYVFSVEMFDALIERLQQLEHNEFVANITEGENQFERGQFRTLQEAAERAEKKWQLSEAAT